MESDTPCTKPQLKCNNWSSPTQRKAKSDGFEVLELVMLRKFQIYAWY